MIRLININKAYGVKSIFRKKNVTIAEGEFIGIKGDSGAGKTTLLNIIGGLESIDEGKRLLNDRDYTDCRSRQQRQLFISSFSFVFQNFGLIQNESIFQNLTYVLKVKKIAKSNYKELITKGLSDVHLDHLDPATPVYSLSGGEQQRVAICRAFLSGNPIILADEPCGSLDDKNSEQMMTLFQQLHRQGRTIIMVTHGNQFDSIFSRIIHLS